MEPEIVKQVLLVADRCGLRDIRDGRLFMLDLQEIIEPTVGAAHDQPLCRPFINGHQINCLKRDNDEQCGRARSHILAGAKPVPEGWPATG